MFSDRGSLPARSYGVCRARKLRKLCADLQGRGGCFGPIDSRKTHRETVGRCKAQACPTTERRLDDPVNSGAYFIMKLSSTTKKPA